MLHILTLLWLEGESDEHLKALSEDYIHEDESTSEDSMELEVSTY